MAALACARAIQPDVTIASPTTRPDSAVAWWKALEECSGKLGDLSAVTWLSTPGYLLRIEGAVYSGYWLRDRNAVIFGEDLLATADRGGHLIRHELLHALLQTGSHPTEYFGRKCRRLVVRP